MVEKKIPFNRLPKNVQERVQIILSHRKGIQENSRMFFSVASMISGEAAVPIALVYSMGHPKPAIALGASAGLAFFGWGLHSMKSHGKQYLEEEARLLRSIALSRDDSIQQFRKHFPWIAVDRHGDLVGKRFRPRISFIPIGRRRIPTQHWPGKGKLRQWAKRREHKRWLAQKRRMA